MITFRVKGRLPKPVKPDREMLRKIGRAIKEGNVENVKRQRGPRGGKIKRNRKSTLARKRREGKPLKSLIDEKHRFLTERSYVMDVDVAAGNVEVRPHQRLTKIVRSLIARGYIWIGMSKRTRAKIDKIIKAWIRKKYRVRRG